MALDTLDKLTAPMPAPPVRQFSFTDFATNNPTTPPPGDRLDAEFDRANAAITDTIDWASVSLNTDGSIRDGAIGENNLQPDLFDNIASDAIAQVQPLVDQAAGYAGAAASSASAASGSATTASAQAVIANGAANSASNAQTVAQAANASAQGYATTAQGAATNASNAGNDAAGAAAKAQDYAVVTQAWAEHMPDPIPPNILAVMGVTGDHWSSRWWANQAAAAFGSLASLYLGAHPQPPTTTSTGGEIPIGAIYYDTTSNQPYVWTGTEWQPFYAPTKSLMLMLNYLATAGQTTFNLSTPDRNGQSFVVNPNDPEPLDVYVDGLRLPRDAPVNGTGNWDFDPSTNTLTFLAPLAANDGVLIDVLAPASSIAPSRVQTQSIEDLPTDGTTTSFPLFLIGHTALQVGSAQELFISLDGVPQKPGTDYSVSAGNIVFNEAPLAGSRAWGLWYGPGTTQSGGPAYLPILGGTLTGPLTLYGPPAQAMEAANKGYVDGQITSVNPTGKYLPITGGTVTGPTTHTASLVCTTTLQGQAGLTAGTNSATTGATIQVNGAAANQRYVFFATAGSTRMRFGVDATAENGSNAGSNPFMNLYSDAGALIGQAWTINRATLQSYMPRLRLGQTISYTGQAPSSDVAALNISANYSGNTDGSGWVNLNGIAINSDTLAIGASQQAIGFNMNYNVGGAGITGNRTAHRVQITSTGASPAHANFQGVLSSVTMQHACGGTDLWANSGGVVFGSGIYGQLMSGATNWRGVVGLEIDYGIYSGATASGITGLQVIRWTGHAFAPPMWEIDEAIAIGSGSTVGAKFGLIFGLQNGTWPIDATNGRLIGAGFTNGWTGPTPMAAAHGLDWYNVDLKRTALRMRGFSVLGSGRTLPVGTVQVGGGYLSSSGSTVSLDAVGSVCTGATIVSGGANLVVGTPLIDDATGTLVQVATVDGTGAATAITLVANTGSAHVPPANPVTMRVSTNAVQTFIGAPTAPTLNLTWSASNQLTLQPSGGPTSVGGTLTAPTLIRTGAQADQSADVVAMVNAGTHTILNGTSWCCLTAGSTITSYTLTMPGAPLDGHDLWISTSAAITKLTLSPNTGQTISEVPAGMAANSNLHYRYRAATTSWTRMSKPARASYQQTYVTGASVGNGADTTEDTLQTFTLPANTVSAAGDQIVIEAMGTFGGTTDSKSARVKIGAVTLAALNASTAGNTTWYFRGVLTRTTISAFRSALTSLMGNQPVALVTGTPGITETADNVVAVTGQNNTSAAAGSVACTYLGVTFIPAGT